MIKEKLNGIKWNKKGVYGILWTSTESFPDEPLDTTYSTIVDYTKLESKIYNILDKDNSVKELKVIELPTYFKKYSMINRNDLSVDDIKNLYTIID